MRVKGHYDYDERMFTEIGIDRGFYQSFIRPMILKLKGKKCQDCSSTKSVQVHHSDLKHININTLLVLCSSCHRGHHTEGELK